MPPRTAAVDTKVVLFIATITLKIHGRSHALYQLNKKGKEDMAN